MGSDTKQPVAALARFPSGYGTPHELLAWETVRAELESAKQYWLSITGADRPPHVRPLDGVWIDERWFYGGSPETRHVQAVAASPQATLHLPDPWRAVIVEGVVEEVEPPQDLVDRLIARSYEKYPEYGKPDPRHYTTVRYLRPQRAYAWTSFPTDATRFTFD
jgi:nitroimidazol reductase NimA-like FMN-containing flavoprotein (pyridoxamine 5'-phosphate oxidase superfamily)